MFGVIILFLLPTMVALSGENQVNVSETSSVNPYVRELLREWCPKAFEEPSKRKSLHPSKVNNHRKILFTKMPLFLDSIGGAGNGGGCLRWLGSFDRGLHNTVVNTGMDF
jgi:hypothetical protein